MPSENNRTAFDRLVSGLSAQDRTEMLRRLNGEGLASVRLVGTEEETSEKNVSLHYKFQTLPFYQKFIIKAKFYSDCQKRCRRYERQKKYL